jgi:hypothetical protein
MADEEQIDDAELENFTEVSTAREAEDRVALAEARVAELRVLDVDWRIKSRGPIAWTLIALLLLQNAAVVGAGVAAAAEHDLANLSGFLIGITAGTLGETALIVQIIVRWLFADIEYPRRK